MTRRRPAAGAGVNAPAESVVPATSVGCTRTPPLAMVAYTLAIWIAVTPRPWPKAYSYRLSAQ